MKTKTNLEIKIKRKKSTSTRPNIGKNFNIFFSIKINKSSFIIIIEILIRFSLFINISKK
jgi:hypothetical protein